MTVVHHPIAIIGGGLGGLTLARVLHVHGIEAPVFEGDPAKRTRGQGGMLDIHADSGQVALRAAKLHDEFLELEHRGGQAFRLIDSRGVVRLEEEDDGTGDRPEVERGRLRALLLDSLPPEAVRWGRKVTGAEPIGDGRHEVRFADGSRITTDLLIGADGAWSRVRPLVSGARPHYTGISSVASDLHEADARHAACAELVGGGFFISVDDQRGFLGHREPDGSLHVDIALRAEESWLDGLDLDTPAGMRELLAQFDGWHDTLRALITDSDTPLVPRRVYALPTGHRWPRVPGVTLLGDAAHLMSPFAGEGANLAIFDGAELARALVEHPGATETALAAYEAEMFPRGEASARESAENLEMIFGENGAQRLLDAFASHAAD